MSSIEFNPLSGTFDLVGTSSTSNNIDGGTPTTLFSSGQNINGGSP